MIDCNEMWDRLLELGVSEQTLQIVTSLNGFSDETMLDVLFVHTGYRSFDQVDSDYDPHDPHDADGNRLTPA